MSLVCLWTEPLGQEQYLNNGISDVNLQPITASWLRQIQISCTREVYCELQRHSWKCLSGPLQCSEYHLAHLQALLVLGESGNSWLLVNMY